MKKRHNFSKACIVLFLTLFVLVTLEEQKSVHAQENTTQFLVKEDAFVRNGSRANTNYNFENITNEHGSQYVGKEYRVTNVKYSGSDEIISVMKFDLPTVSQMESNNLDTFKFECDIFKNLNYNNANQGYVFHYTTDSDWKETEITWNKKPATITRENENKLFTFYIEQGNEYEFKTDEEKHINRDISSVITELVYAGETEITIFVTAKYSANTGLMIHCKETSVESKRAKITATNSGINKESLKTLINLTTSIKPNNYTKESFDVLNTSLLVANTLIEENADDVLKIREVYSKLLSAYESLEIKYVNVYDDMQERIYREGTEDSLPYRLFIPENYDASKEYPVIVFLHGAGERGNNNNSQLKNAIQPLFNTQEQVKEAIIIAPQCPTGKRWVETDWTKGCYDSDSIEEVQLKSVMGILADIQNEYSTDSDRIYAFGLSMGGFGTWDLITRHSDVFAAAIPICGSGDASKTDILKDIPIWTFHGTKDAVVPYSGTETMYNAITGAGGEKIIFTTYIGADHIIWNQAASEDGLIDWLFSQRLSHRMVNKDLLMALIEESNTLKEKDYTPNSWKLFIQSLTKAKDRIENSASTQEEVNDALSALQNAIDQLLNKADVSALEALIRETEELIETDYTPNSWKSFMQSLTIVKEVIENGNSTQEEINTALSILQVAKKQLLKRGDLNTLRELIMGVENLNEKDYTISSWTELSKVITEARLVLTDDNVSEEDVIEILRILKEAIASLEKINSIPAIPAIDTNQKQSPTTNSVKTSDTTSSLIWFGLMILSIGILTINRNKQT